LKQTLHQITNCRNIRTLITPRIKVKYFASSSGGKYTDATSVYGH
jgi:hypothetical protein